MQIDTADGPVFHHLGYKSLDRLTAHAEAMLRLSSALAVTVFGLKSGKVYFYSTKHIDHTTIEAAALSKTYWCSTYESRGEARREFTKKFGKQPEHVFWEHGMIWAGPLQDRPKIELPR